MGEPHGKAAAAAPYDSSAHEYRYDAAAEHLQRIDLAVSAATAEDAAPEETPSPPLTEAPAPQPPMEASPSWSAAAGGGRGDECSRRRLLGIGRDKVELTEEEARANDRRQEDEICALEAIFGDSVVMFNRKEGQRTFQVHVNVEILDGIDVSATLSSGAGTMNYKEVQDGDASDDDLFYRAWLQSSSLSCLGLDNEIALSKGDQTCTEDGEDKRACPANSPPDVMIPRIMRYNDEKCHEAFLHAIRYCLICFSEFPGVDFIKLPCHHFFCQKCMQTYSKMHVKEGTVVKLLCPDTKCGAVVPPNILKRLLGEDDFKRWEALLLQRTLDAMVDVVYCPRCQTACLEDAGDEAVCPSCLFSFCTLCRERRHVGVECLSPEERLHILEKRQESERRKKGVSRKKKMKGDIQKRMDEAYSIMEILKDAKQCPQCKMAISKIEGCNKMTCWNCGQCFCYQCSAAISGYDHFKGDCVVFDQAELDRWEIQINQRAQRQMLARVQAALFEGEYYPCPTCRQPVPKIGNNNHLYCWFCNQHCCALCRKPVQKMTQHFGPTGCKQHTANR